MQSTTIARLVALCPLVLFFGLFLGCGLYFSVTGKENAFYQVSSSVAILPSIILAILLCKERFNRRMDIFLEGVSDTNIMVMVLIYLLAGAFAAVLQSTGGVHAIVHFSLNFISAEATLPVLFLVSALVSTAIGTSMGTIAAIGPIGVGIASSLGLSLPLTMGVLVGGAMFGDNLSLISDTSIAATQIHGCTPQEKFNKNLKVALPTMLVTVLLISLLGSRVSGTPILAEGDYQLIQCLPYFMVLVFSLSGVNVFVVLTLGIVVAGIVGVLTIPTYTFLTVAHNIFDGYKSMLEILIFSLLISGLGALIKYQGGFSLITGAFEKWILSKKKIQKRIAEFSMAILVSFTDICTANNTTSIILSGEMTREIARKNNVAPDRSATIVDLFSCVFQGILPYGAQILMAGSLAGISPLSIIVHVHYCYLLGIAGVGFILFGQERKCITAADHPVLQ